jgi:hypothetical protein
MSNRAKEIYRAATSLASRTTGEDFSDVAFENCARDVIWMAQCTDAERAEALRMLDARAAGRST